MVGQVISAIQSKGGVGKSTLLMTLASLISADGYRIRLIDADPQLTMSRWAHKSGLDSILTVVSDENEIVSVVETAKEEVNLVLVDTAGVRSQMTVYVAGVSDLVLIPSKASEDDAEGAIGAVRQVHSTSQMIKREIPILVIMSEIDPQASISTHIKGQIKREGIPVLSTDMNGLTGFKEMQTFGGKPTGAALRMANQVLGNLQVDGYIDCYNQVKMKVAK